MSAKKFFGQLGIITALTCLAVFMLGFFFEPFKIHWKFSGAAVLLFAGICIGLFYAGAASAKSKNKHGFTNLVSVSVFGKMAVSFGFLLLYRSLAKPENDWYVFLFLAVYMVYTVFEIVFMTRLAKS